jgi:hypothetical protein
MPHQPHHLIELDTGFDTTLVFHAMLGKITYSNMYANTVKKLGLRKLGRQYLLPKLIGMG